MLDIKLLRQNIDEVAKNLAQRGFTLEIEHFHDLESKRKKLQIELQELQNERNSKSKQIGIAKSKGENADAIMQDVANLGAKLDEVKKEFDSVHHKLNDIFLLSIPNMLHESVPVGKSEEDNKVVRTVGEIKEFNFKPKEHFDLEKDLDFDAAAKISGSRFVVLKNKIAKLHRALAQFMIDTHVKEHGYQEIYVPLLVNSQALYGTSQFPKFIDDQFGTNAKDLWLIPTAEVPLTNLVRDSILSEKELPIKFAALSTCFRKEAGSYGKDTKGMIRQHQFEKVELVHISTPEKSYEQLEELTANAENILKKLKLPYRVSALCSGDIGFGAAKTYDLEVWLPGQNAYREISSCSNMASFQARRMQARVRNAEGKTEYLHTLNGSGVAVGRALVAVMENYQDEKGRIHIPEVLLPYMNGIEIID